MPAATWCAGLGCLLSSRTSSGLQAASCAGPTQSPNPASPAHAGRNGGRCEAACYGKERAAAHSCCSHLRGTGSGQEPVRHDSRACRSQQQTTCWLTATPPWPGTCPKQLPQQQQQQLMAGCTRLEVAHAARPRILLHPAQRLVPRRLVLSEQQLQVGHLARRHLQRGEQCRVRLCCLEEQQAEWEDRRVAAGLPAQQEPRTMQLRM